MSIDFLSLSMLMQLKLEQVLLYQTLTLSDGGIAITPAGSFQGHTIR
jgi:hypothetical protein